jgi:hypothetical protein
LANDLFEHLAGMHRKRLLITAPGIFNQVCQRVYCSCLLALNERVIGARGRSECDVGAHCERVELRADIADIGYTHLLGDVAVKVIEHEPDVRFTYQFRPAVWTVCFPPATPFAVAS